MTDGLVGFAEKPPTVAASKPRHKGRKAQDCNCDHECKRLRGDHDHLRQRLENHLLSHQLEEEEQKPAVWTYKCSVQGCPQLIETGPPDTRVGKETRCPTHGLVTLYLVSPVP